MFFPGLDPCQHGAGSDPDGTIHIPTGCFLIQGAGRTILVDAGLGPVTLPFPDGMPTARTVAGRATPPLSEGGDLPAQLRAAGVESSDVDTVLLTHLHGDHIGWVAPRGAPYFDAATVMFGEPDWTDLIENGPPTDPGVQGMKIARDRGRLQTITTETHSIAFLTDLDPALATRTRQRVFDAMEREHAAIGMDHFPGLGFQQIIAGAPRKWLPV
jgi:hypothetical protein